MTQLWSQNSRLLVRSFAMGIQSEISSPVQGVICPKRGPIIPRIGRYSKFYNMLNAVPGADMFQPHFFPPDHALYAWYLGRDRAMVVVHEELKPVGTGYILWLLPWWLNCLEALLLQFGCIRWAFKLSEGAIRQSTMNRQRECTTSPACTASSGTNHSRNHLNQARWTIECKRARGISTVGVRFQEFWLRLETMIHMHKRRFASNNIAPSMIYRTQMVAPRWHIVSLSACSVREHWERRSPEHAVQANGIPQTGSPAQGLFSFLYIVHTTSVQHKRRHGLAAPDVHCSMDSRVSLFLETVGAMVT